MSDKPIQAVYFPGEVDYLRQDSDYSQLKKTLIYFDRVLTLIPEKVFTGDNYLWQEHYGGRPERVQKFLAETAILRNAEVLTYINPVENILHYDPVSEADKKFQQLGDLQKSLSSVLVSNIRRDTEDDLFRAIVDELKLEPIPLFTGQLEINWFAGVSSSKKERDIWHDPSLDKYGYGHFSAFVSPQLGAAVLLNHALMTAIKYEAIPVASNSAFNRLLENKLKRISQNSQLEQALKTMRTRQSWDRDFLASSLINIYLPNFELESFDDVLELREKIRDELFVFRLHLNKLISNVRMSPITDLQVNINQIIDTEIEPALSELKRKLELSNDKFLLKVFKGLKSAQTTIPLIGSVFVGLPLWLGIALSAGAVTIDAAIETYFEKREATDSNGLSFLLKFQ